MYYIPKQLIVINKVAVAKEDDEVFMSCMQLAFRWANDMGLQGKIVYGPHVNKNEDSDQVVISVTFPCTKEEREEWERQQNDNIKHAVNTFLQDEE